MPETPAKDGKDPVTATDSDDDWEDESSSSPESMPTAPLLIRGLTADGASSSNSESAVDDSEDLPDRDFAKARKVQKKRDERLEARAKFSKVQRLLPFQFCPNVRPLTISDLESCVALEDAAFANPAQRCTRDKFAYRLSTCPELCLGLFCTVVPDQAQDFDIETLKVAQPVETGRNDGARSVLLAHIVSTRSNDLIVTDAAMDYPRDYRTSKTNTSGLGHQDGGQTICIHSLAVHPKLHGCGLAKLLMKSYLQQIKNSEMAPHVALLCEDYLVNFYERFSFRHLGKSIAVFGGGGWHDMVEKESEIAGSVTWLFTSDVWAHGVRADGQTDGEMRLTLHFSRSRLR
ncbi:acyl-CoA N-acyltransferase [Hypomontagnella monticulosa]|nr:acyl-CoA N-acyltransferase [Hypomontagnella monticulosa]